MLAADAKKNSADLKKIVVVLIELVTVFARV
jgi:hypothetical protein